ncbi:MAG: flavin reductase, partial [Gammaproteobacteria bacterium]|nr:flavin reductase [Gammaproteobacteria bacterium]
TASNLLSLDVSTSIWEKTFMVSPLVLVGSKDEGNSFDLAPKHLAMPLSWTNRYGFVCTPRHATYHNVVREKVFTVSFPTTT